MRPPDLPGGNVVAQDARRFVRPLASMRPPDLPGGNTNILECDGTPTINASMRPPDLPGGNTGATAPVSTRCAGFNEAAGFTRRKLFPRPPIYIDPVHASMRPPDLPGGNPHSGGRGCSRYRRWLQ